MDRARPGSKHHLITDARGIPLAVTLTGGHRHDITQLIPLIEAIPPIRGRRGRPARRPRQLFADRGYDFDAYRRQLRHLGIAPHIARRNTPHGSGLGAHRWVIERSFAWLHAFKRLRTRYEHQAAIHLALLQLACALICYRHLGLPLVAWTHRLKGRWRWERHAGSSIRTSRRARCGWSGRPGSRSRRWPGIWGSTRERSGTG